jgi:predicted transcriptional regulator
MARPTIKITDEQRKQVQTLAGYGLNHEQIARMLGITRQTLAKHCKEELAKGKDVAYTTAVNALFDNIKRRKEASIFFYLKTQHCWRERQEVQHTGTVGFKLIIEGE